MYNIKVPIPNLHFSAQICLSMFVHNINLPFNTLPNNPATNYILTLWIYTV